jgi:hypothetical protein
MRACSAPTPRSRASCAAATAVIAVAPVPPRYVMFEPGARCHVTPQTASQIVYADFRTLTGFLRAEIAAGRGLPEDVGVLYSRLLVHPVSARMPDDPFSGDWYHYEKRGNAFVLRSAGRDGEFSTFDDIVYEWPGADSAATDHWPFVEPGSGFVPAGIAQGALFGWVHRTVVRVGGSQFEAWWERRWEDSTHTSRYELDCTARRYRLLSVVERDSSGVIVRQEAVPKGELTWSAVAPHTESETLFLAVCGFATGRNLPDVRRRVPSRRATRGTRAGSRGLPFDSTIRPVRELDGPAAGEP